MHFHFQPSPQPQTEQLVPLINESVFCLFFFFFVFSIPAFFVLENAYHSFVAPEDPWTRLYSMTRNRHRFTWLRNLIRWMLSVLWASIAMSSTYNRAANMDALLCIWQPSMTTISVPEFWYANAGYIIWFSNWFASSITFSFATNKQTTSLTTTHFLIECQSIICNYKNVHFVN